MLTRTFWVSAAVGASLLAAPCAWSAETAAVVDPAMHFRPIAQAHGVEFRWRRYPKPKGFVGYEILRSSTAAAEAVIRDGVLAGHTANRYSTNFEELLDRGTYRYQLCAVTKTGRICSKQVKVVITRELPEELKPDRPDTEADVRVEVRPAPAGRLQLSVRTGADGVRYLSWTPLSDNAAELKYYKPLRSSAADPAYPRDGYLAHIPEWDRVTAMDDRAPTGTANYRVCAVDGQDGLWCGNVVSVN